MANYTKLTDFASKDSLPTGSPAKIVKGTEIDDEFQSIENAISTKADQTYVDAIDLSVVWPIGSVYINAASTTNPSTLLGFGTWVEIGQGRVLVGQNISDSVFDTMGETGGLKDATLQAHTHEVHAATSAAGNHSHTFGVFGGGSGGVDYAQYTNGGGQAGTVTTSGVGDHNHEIHAVTTATGTDGTNKNLQPYLVVKMWQRTA